MGTARRAEIASATRWLGAPPTLVGLALLLINDRVLKDQWPGLVTGKLSDVAGLMVVPPLLALLLAVIGVPHIRAWAVGATGVLFAAAKGLAVGSAVASAMWSVAIPSVVRHDPTDLVALPVLWLAWRTGGWGKRSGRTRRQRAALALGTLALPCAVFATTATSCSPRDGLRRVTVYEGVFTGGSGTVEQRIVIGDYSVVTIDGAGRLEGLSELDRARLGAGAESHATSVCSATARQQCWRGTPDRPAAVDSSTDGGTTWRTEFVVDERVLQSVREDVGDERCGSEPPLGVADVAVLDGPAGYVVAAASSNTGLLLRSARGEWRRLSVDELRTTANPAPTPAPEVQLYPVEPTPLEPTPLDTPTAPTGTSGPVPTRTCATPDTRTYTPDPRNGPPATVTRCP